MSITTFTPQILRNGTRAVPEIPAGGGGGFTNTYSLEFDGVDDYLTSGDLSALVDNKSKLSISFWVNLPDASEINRITGKYGGSLTKWIAITCTSNKVSFVVSNIGSSLAYAETSAVLSNNTWHHVACVFDGTQATATDRIKIYIDNIDETFAFNGTLPTSTYDFTLEPTNPTWYVAQSGAQLGSNELRGKLDEYAIYSNVALTPSEVNEINNGGTPNDLSTLSVTPDLWYRMGDNGDYKSPQWLLPNNENKDKVSNYSFDFDGVDDYVDCGNISELNGVTEASWSIWSAKGDTTDDYLMSCYSLTSSLRQYLFHQYSDKLYIYLSNSGGTLRLMNRIDYTFNIDEWYHIGIVYNEAEVSNADKVKVYINGILQVNQQSGFALTSLRSTTASTNIGRATDFTSQEYGGKIDEVAIFDTAIDIADVWDGSGEPIDVSAVSGIVSYYKMGEEATFSGGVWTVPDAVGSNNGTSNGMLIDARIGTAPSSSNNAVSFNMDLVDRVEDTPPNP